MSLIHTGKAKMKPNLNVAGVTMRRITAGLCCVAMVAGSAWADPAVITKTSAARVAPPAGSTTKRPIAPAVVPKAIAAAETQPNGASTSSETRMAIADTQATIGPNLDLKLGKATLLRLPEPIERISVGNPMIADVTVISPREIYVLGKDLGSTNVIIWAKAGQTVIVDVRVGADPALLEAELRDMLPSETDIKVKTSADSLVLTGTVADAFKADQAVQIAQAWIRRLTRGLIAPVSTGDGKSGTTIAISESQNVTGTAATAGPRVVNLLSVRAAQQVMLEVKVAEVSKNLLDRLGVSIGKTNSFGDKGVTYSLFSTSDFFNQLLGTARAATSIRNFAQIDAQRDDGLIKLLAEPNLMAISGQEASFNAGGKIFIPVARNNDVGGTTITLEEKEFGVGVKFKPTVLEGGRINLQVASRVSEPVQNGNPFATTNGVVTILPSFNERRAETTVQLYDGQSFMIAGLIKSDSSQTVKRFPGLGELPIIGTLFRSTQFQKDKSELMFVITPRLVQPLPPNHTLPTDNFIEPTRREYFFEGKTEGSRPNQQSQTQPVQKPGAANAQPGGFDVK
jgi:pilus assembly protein CpaC